MSTLRNNYHMLKKPLFILVIVMFLSGCAISNKERANSGSSSEPKPAATSLTIEEKYYECVEIKSSLRTGFLELSSSILQDDNELWAWFALTNSILDERRDFLSEQSLQLIDAYQYNFDRYQILQCEINFPVLKDPEVNPYGQDLDDWTPSAIV